MYKPDKKVWAKMKTLITELNQTINPKFLPPMKGPSYQNVVGMSNNLGDVIIDDNDRR